MHKLAPIVLIFFFSGSDAFAAGDGTAAASDGSRKDQHDRLATRWETRTLKRGESDEDDSPFPDAVHVSLPSGTSRRMDAGDEAHYFRFEASGCGTVLIRLTGISTAGVLFDARGSRIVEDEASPDSTIERTLDEGTYYVRVQPKWGSVGVYTLHLDLRSGGIDESAGGPGGFDDHGNTRATATPVAFPSTAYGRIDPEDDVDYFRFEVPAGETLVVRTTGTGARGTLFDARGCGVVQEEGFRIERDVDEGTYYVRIEYGPNWGGGNWDLYYTLHVGAARETDEEDDHGNTRATATRVALPSTTSGRISADNVDATDLDYFRFEVPAGGGIVVMETSGDMELWGTLFDAAGTVLLESVNGLRRSNTISTSYRSRGGRSARNFHMEQSLDEGTYYIVVSKPLSRPGGYMLHLHLRDGGDDDHGDTRSTATRIALPSFASGSVPFADDTDYFRFEVSASETIAIDVIELWDRHDLTATVFDAQGEEVEEDKRVGNRIKLTLAEGTYYVRMVRRESARNGSYVLNLQSSSVGDDEGEVGECNDHCDTRSAATLVALPGGMGGAIDPGNDTDYFRFEVSASSTVTIESTFSGGNVDTVGTLFDARGSRIAQDDDSGSYFHFRIERTLDAGTYYVRVNSLGATAGGYILYLQSDASGGDEGGVWDAHGDTRSAATHVALPSTTPGMIDTGNDTDYFRFEVSADADVVVESSDDLDTVGTLFGVYGDYIAQDDNAAMGANFRIEQSLGEGTYYVRVHSRGRKTGGYHLVLRGGGDGGNRSDDHGDTPSTATGVALPSTTSGRIDPVNDRDYFRIEMPNSGTVVIESLGGSDTVGTLFDASGDRMAQDDDGGEWLNFLIERTLDEGTYYVRVDSFWGTTGRYHLAARVRDGQSTSSKTFRDCAECPAMVPLPAGHFLMGAWESEPHSRSGERPRRAVSVPSFAVSAYEVTFAEWDACVADGGCDGYWPDDAGWGRGDRPVINVSWEDAQLYVEWLSGVTGQAYRLPTEAEWEYAARAGTATPFYTGGTISPRQANYDGRHGYPEGYDDEGLYRRKTTPVGSFAANTLGLHDVHGNVAELVQDCYNESHQDAPADSSAREGGDCDRVLRGGAWNYRPQDLRSAYRNWTDSRNRSDHMGFRVVRTLTP